MSLSEIFNTQRSILQKVEIPDLVQRGIKLYVKRDDLIHSEVSGNKWRKLKYNIEQVYQGKFEGVLTFGGAFFKPFSGNSECVSSIRVEIHWFCAWR